MDGDRLEITVEARLLWFLGLRECDNPSDSISRRNFPPLPVDTAISSNRWRYVKGERRGKPSRDAGLVRDSIIQLPFFSLDSDSDSDSDSDLYLDSDLYSDLDLYLDWDWDLYLDWDWDLYLDWDFVSGLVT